MRVHRNCRCAPRRSPVPGLVFLLAASASNANPTGGQVEAGSVDIEHPSPATLQVTQRSDKAIINWDRFDIGVGETTRFVLPRSSSVTLNRDFSGNPSQILGNLQSNGRLYLVNRSGILFGPSARVDVAGLVATTHDIASRDFLDGALNFSMPGESGASVVNQGRITVSDLGFGAFVAPHVRNDGAIVARLGQVEMASANGFTLDLHGDRLISFLVENPNEHLFRDSRGNPITALVENSGSIIADGGQVVLSAKAARGVVDGVINADGIIRANTVGRSGGKIVLSGGETGVVTLSGELKAKGDDEGETGGAVTVTGERIVADATARVDASGLAGGGRIEIGGFGEDGADEVELAEGSELDASGLSGSEGGQVRVLAKDRLIFEGTIRARGEGFVETSSRGSMALSGTVDTGGGRYLIDPENIEIGDTNTTGAQTLLDPGYVLDSIRQNHLTISTDPDSPEAGDGDITVSSALEYESVHDLSLFAAGDIRIYEPIQNHGSGDINLLAGWNGLEGINWRTFDKLDLDRISVFGQAHEPSTRGGSVLISFFYDPVTGSVGSRQGTTRVLGYDVEIIYGQFGYRAGMPELEEYTGPINGDIRIRAIHNILNSDLSRIGHYVGSWPCSLDFCEIPSVEGNIYVEAGNGLRSIGSIGHYSDGLYADLITPTTDDNSELAVEGEIEVIAGGDAEVWSIGHKRVVNHLQGIGVIERYPEGNYSPMLSTARPARAI